MRSKNRSRRLEKKMVNKKGCAKRAGEQLASGDDGGGKADSKGAGFAQWVRKERLCSTPGAVHQMQLKRARGWLRDAKIECQRCRARRLQMTGQDPLARNLSSEARA